MSVKAIFLLVVLFFHALVFAESTQALQKALDQARMDNQVSAMQMTVILPNQETITVVSGETQKTQGAAITPETLFQIGSETKSFTAALLLQLEAEGKVKLSDPLNKYFPQYLQWQSVTLTQLLHNNSGIPNYSENKDFQNAIAQKPDHQWQPQELVAVATKMPMDFKPGKGWHYSNTNFILAGMIAEKVTGDTLTHLYKKYFFTPLNLNHTYYLPTAYDRQLLKRLAHGYDENNKDVTLVNMSWAGAAGALVSNSQDLAKWAYDLFHAKAIPQAQLEKMLQLVSTKTGLPVTKLDPEGYGMGVGMRIAEKYGQWYGHEGETLGYHAIFIYFPERQLTAAIIANGPAEKLRDFAAALPGLIS